MKRSDPARERLLQVGRKLFCAHGYDAVSVRDITAAAEANLGAITYHFGSKEALYHAAIESIAEPFANTIAAAANTPGNALDRIETVVRAALAHMTEQPSAPTMLLRELANGGPLPAPMRNLMKRNIGTLSAIITDGQHEGTIRSGNPVMLALSVVAQPFYFRIASRGIEQAMGIKPNDPVVWKNIVEHVVKSVRHTIAKHPPNA